MTKLFSARHRHSTWRLLWLHLASCQRELGLKRADGSEVVTAEALDQMRAHLEVSDEAFAVAAEREKAVRHDVMAHVYAFGKDAPAAEAVIHAGATSCYGRY